MDLLEFRYEPRCSSKNCQAAARFKIAALWSNGTTRELKNYGLTCEQHRQTEYQRARKAAEGLVLAEGESIGAIGLYLLNPGCRDLELERLPEPAR